jgi:hypothetical protein
MCSLLRIYCDRISYAFLRKLQNVCKVTRSTCSQMHGYDIHGPPPPMTRLDIDPGPVDMMHPDSTDSFVTYLESDDSLHNDTSSP